MRDLKEITLACCIRYVRTKNGITLKELSKKTNCSLQYIGEIERGEKTVPIEKCNEIFSALNIT